MKKITIGIIDDHRIVIDGLRLLLGSDESLEVIMDNTNGLQFIEDLQTAPVLPQVVLLDLMMPQVSGYDCAVMLHRQYPAVEKIVLSMSNDAALLQKLVRDADIKAYLPKSADRQTLVAAIHKVAAGGQYFSEEVIEGLGHSYKNECRLTALGLSNREIEIIRLLAKGRSSKEISAALFLSEFTVATHRKNIARKTNTHNLGSLLALATELKIV